MFDEVRQLLEDKLWEQTVVHPDTGCYLWCGTKNFQSGYGIIHFDIINCYVHRLSAYLFLDLPLGSSLQAGHLCSSKNCWRPEHLHIVTCSENLAERKPFKLRPKLEVGGYCVNGHLLSKKDIRSKMTSMGGIQRCCRICDRESDRKRRAKLKEDTIARYNLIKSPINGRWEAPDGVTFDKPIWKLFQ
jgi:hypothetical protein